MGQGASVRRAAGEGGIGGMIRVIEVCVCCGGFYEGKI